MIDRRRIEETTAIIRPHVRLTPVVAVTGADFGLPPFSLSLKLEHLQHGEEIAEPFTVEHQTGVEIRFRRLGRLREELLERAH